MLLLAFVGCRVDTPDPASGPSIIAIEPAEPTALDDLSLRYEHVGDEAVAPHWSVDGSPVSGSDHIVAARTKKGQTWSVDVGDAQAEVVIGNSAPTLATVLVSPATAQVGDTLTCQHSAPIDVDEDSLDVTITWSTGGTGPSTVAGATGPVSCTVEVDDGDVVQQWTSPDATVGNTAPVLSLAFEPATPVTGDDVDVVVQITDANADVVTTAVNCSLDGVPVVLPASGLRGQLLACSVEASDGTDVAEASAAIVIGNAAPLADLTLTPSAPGVLDAISADVEIVDPEGDAVQLSYRWTVDQVVAGSGPTLSGGFSRGQTVAVSVFPHDGVALGPEVTASVVVGNTPPTAPVVAITPTDPVEQVDTLDCQVVEEADDPDGDPVTYTLTWTGVPVGGEVMTCTATPHDGLSAGAEGNASVVLRSLFDVRFAAIGDFGTGDAHETAVADLVKSLDPEILLTVGDNNYPDGEASTIDRNIGFDYSAFIGDYQGAFGPGAMDNRFFPAPGNHDWNTGTLQPYLDYFTLPGNERYYSFVRGSVEFFSIDSDPHEPDGVNASSIQAQWLQSALAASTAELQVVYMHHPPYSSGVHGASVFMQWPYAEWGADLVLAGHDHDYERIERDIPYVIIGHGGRGLRQMRTPVAGSVTANASEHGALLCDGGPDHLVCTVHGVDGTVMDHFRVWPPVDDSVTVVDWGATWAYRDDGVYPGDGWQTSDVSGWSTGEAELGYGDGDESTVVASGNVTTWFRLPFVCDDVASLELAVVRDDGVAVYLDGVEVLRDNLDADAGPDDYANIAYGGLAESTPVQTAVAMTLEAGPHELAAEIHQAGPASSDISFDLALSGRQRDVLVPWGASWAVASAGSVQHYETTVALTELPSRARLDLVANDGVRVRINGDEVGVHNDPPLTPLEPDWLGRTWGTAVDPAVFAIGDNVIEVDVDVIGVDQGFDLQLLGGGSPL